MPTSWVKGKLKDANGNVASLETLASKVYLDDGQTVSAKLTTINSTESDISSRLTSLSLAVSSLASAVNGDDEEDS